MRLSNAILASAFALVPATALAQRVDGLYVGAGIGLNAPDNPHVTPYGPGLGFNGLKLHEDWGFTGDVALGYGFGNGWRVEIEGDVLRNGVRSLEGTGFPTAPAGTVRTWGVMTNVYYDVDLGLPFFYPYIGLGAGYQWTKMSGVSFQNPGPFYFGTNSQDGAFAWQAIVGASFPLPWFPNIAGTVDYRFMDILGGEKFSGVGTNTGGALVGSGFEMRNRYENQFVLGIRYAFNTTAQQPPPAPTPVAAPAPAPARSYLVFFDWDKANLTDRARAIVKEAAENSTRVQYTRIDVNGYTDTSGAPSYNQELSVRRAKAVAGELVRDGVPQAAISIQGYGETHLLVPTGPNVREPQNRRVEIVMH